MSFGRGIKNQFHSRKIAEAPLWMTLDSDDRQKYIPVGFRYGVDGHIIGIRCKRISGSRYSTDIRVKI